MAELGNQPAFPDPLEVRLDDLMLQSDNSLRIRLSLDGGELMTFELMPDSEAHGRVVELLNELATAKLSLIGGRGLRITGLTPPTVEDE